MKSRRQSGNHGAFVTNVTTNMHKTSAKERAKIVYNVTTARNMDILQEDARKRKRRYMKLTKRLMTLGIIIMYGRKII